MNLKFEMVSDTFDPNDDDYKQVCVCCLIHVVCGAGSHPPKPVMSVTHHDRNDRARPRDYRFFLWPMALHWAILLLQIVPLLSLLRLACGR